ncbi:MAG TPA: pseudouridine synthase [Burkholderiales bacterium]|nr:pseudouridine synthase [Burkholderiales bacterium]
MNPSKKPPPAPPSPSKPEPAPQAERLQKLLAAAGLGSRREIETWIEAGRVSVAGKVARLGDRARPGDPIAVDGRAVSLSKAAEPRVLVYHKPVGELVTRSDPQGRPTVFSRLPPGRWVAVGRLDINSAGLLLFTDSGELANRLMHPRYEIEREYVARVHGRLSPEVLEKLRSGVHLEDGDAAFVSIREEEAREGAGSNRRYRVVLREGRNREVRRLFEAVGAQVNRLTRVRYGPLRLPEDLAPGGWREIKNPVILQKL